MKRPLQENLELNELEGKPWVQCARCGHQLCAAGMDWKAACVTRLLPPNRMGPHREILEGRLLLQERYCPGCGVTLDAAVVEVDNSVGERKASEPTRPQPLKLSPATTAVVVLDLNKSSYDPKHPSYSLFEPAKAFLERARSASIPIVFTVVVWEKDTPDGAVAEPLARRVSEPVLYPNGYDKFVDGDLQTLLQRWRAKNLVFLGGSANFALLYTATTAVRTYGYWVVIPVDGIYARSTYEMEYSLYQFTVLPRVADRFRFTKLACIEFS